MYVSDSILQERVLSELRCEPAVDAAEIGVTAHNHVITLQGNVRSYREKVAAERAARRLFGVRAVANEIAVAATGAHGRSDSDIAGAALHALSWSLAVPENAVTLTVERGFVTLHGDVEWDFQRQACEQAVRDLRGVVGLSDRITITPSASASDIEERIAGAFERHAALDARRIRVTASGGQVELHGVVHSLAEREQAGDAAWAAAGVSGVDNRLVVNT